MNKQWLGAGMLACAVAASAIVMKEPGLAMDGQAREHAVAALIESLRTRHAERLPGEHAATAIAQRDRAGSYAGIHDRRSLAGALNRDLPPEAGVIVEYSAPSRWPGAAPLRTESYPAAIGYLAVARFEPVAQAAPQFARALHELRHARSIIVDLRGNRGGDAAAMRLLASYFMDRQLRWSDVRTPSGQVQEWTEPSLPQKPHLGQVAILVDHGTCAEAEEFAYTMQRLKRGPVIGQRTAGLAWRTLPVRLDHQLIARVPAAVPTAPDSDANWQGAGVQPDMATVPADALRRAHIAILKDRLAHATTPMAQVELREMIDELHAQQQ